MWLNLCNAVGLVPGLDEDKAALLRGLSRDADDDELPLRSVREGNMLIVRVSCIFLPLVLGNVTALCLLKFELCRMCFFPNSFPRCVLTWESF